MTAGTIFYGIRKPLLLWSHIMWWIVTQKTGVSVSNVMDFMGFGSGSPVKPCVYKKDPDTFPIPAQSLEKHYHINGTQLERHYKEHLSDFKTWKPSSHARKWLVSPENIGSKLSVDEIYF